MRLFAGVVLAGLLAAPVAASELEETIIVTGSRVNAHDEIPGTSLERNADYLLLPVTIVNDSRLVDQRHDEIYKTLRNLLAATGRDEKIEISVIVDESFVRPLTEETLKIDLIENRDRPDTSRGMIRISTPLEQSSNAVRRIDGLKAFLAKISRVGRTELIAEEQPELSILNPGQYRDAIIALAAEDIRRVTAALGEGYRVHLTGMDRPVKWVRSGLAEVTLYIPYRYEVLPAAGAYFINRYE